MTHTDPCPAPFNLAAYVLAQAARLPDKIALAVLSPTRSDRWSYARLEDRVLDPLEALRHAPDLDDTRRPQRD